MPKRKVAIALSPWLLDEADELAAEKFVSRSALIEEAVTAYVVKQQARKHDDEYRRDALEALEDMKTIAAEYAADPRNADQPDSLTILRELRADGRRVGQ